MSSHIIVRNRRFKTTAQNIFNSASAEPISVALYTSLSSTFPLGEAFFVRSVAQFSKDIPNDLKIAVDAFVRQEALHSREHANYNQIVAEAGLPIADTTESARQQLEILDQCRPLKRLAVTAGLEHFTAVFAQVLLSDPRHIAHCDPQTKALWHWHCVEEIEHKAVAMDVFNYMTKAWSPLQRWLFRCGVMIETMGRLAYVVWNGMAATLHAQGVAQPGWQLVAIKHVFVAPGLLSAMAWQVAQYFKPGFHPNDTDESALLADAKLKLDAIPA